jgi:hypothetical protein
MGDLRQHTCHRTCGAVRGDTPDDLKGRF